jgi:site-specific recombinase XerD
VCFKRLKKRTGIDDKRASAHQCRRYIVTTQLATGRGPLDVQRQMGNTTLHMTNKYASLMVGYLKKSYERHSPLQADTGGASEVLETGYWDE